MSNKFTKSQLEKIIKEEVSKLINEETTSPLDKYGAGLKVNLDSQNMQFVVSDLAIKKVRDEFDSLLSALAPVIGNYRGIASKGKNSSGGIPGFDLLTTQVLQKPETWVNMIKNFWMPQEGTVGAITSKGPQRLVREGIRALFNAVEKADNQFDDLDPYDGFASPGFGRAKAGMDSDQRFAYLYMRNRMPNVSARHEYPDALVTTFINWLLDKASGGATTQPPAPVPAPDNTPFVDQGPPMPDDITDPDTPSGGGSGGSCRQFNRLAVKVTGKNNVREAVKIIQVMLVNLGHSVKRDEIDSGFGPRTGFESLQLGNADFKKAGIDGRCGPGTMGAVKRFQKSNNLKVDGLVGPETWPVLSSGGIERIIMNAEVPLKQTDSVAINTGEEEVKEASLREVKDQLSKWKKLWS
jgi:hypothetical protein